MCSLSRATYPPGKGRWGGHGVAVLLRRDVLRQRNVEIEARAGADALEINVQQHYDQIEAIEFAVKAVQRVTERQLCLSSDIPEVLEAGLRACQCNSLVNYVSADEKKLKAVLPLAARYKAGIVLLVDDATAIADTRQMLLKTAVLVGAANEAGIPNERIIVDPGLIHVTISAGQQHMSDVLEFLRALPDASDPPVRSTCWLANSSTGAARPLRPVIETALLPLLAGAGLSSVFLDILRPENQRAIRLLKIFTNEIVYADEAIKL